MKKIALLITVLTLAGCSSGGGSSATTASRFLSQLSQATPIPWDVPVVPLPVNTDLCASLGGRLNEDSGCSDPTSGLAGNIYVLPYTPPSSDTVDIGYIIRGGERLSQRIQMTDFNVGARSFSEGFPLFDGTLLKGSNGQPVTAWFAFDLQGTLTLQAPYASGDYQFAFFVDDGAILKLDDQVILNFDGLHSPQWACSSTPVRLNEGVSHSVAFQYFQGPPTEIALRLLMRPYDANRPCNDSGDYLPIPKNFFKH